MYRFDFVKDIVAVNELGGLLEGKHPIIIRLKLEPNAFHPRYG